MKNYASIFNGGRGELESSHSSLRDSQRVWKAGDGMEKKLSQRTVDRGCYGGYVMMSPRNNNLCENPAIDKVIAEYKHSSPYCMKKPSYYASSSTMQNVHDLTHTSFKQYKTPTTSFDSILFKEKRNINSYTTKQCYSGNDLHYTSANTNNNKPSSYLQRKTVNCSNMSNYTHCSTDIKLDDLKTCRSRQKSPSRKSVNEKQNLTKKSNHSRHVSTFASFEHVMVTPTPTMTVNHKIGSSQKSSGYQRPYRTSIKQLFPDEQQQQHRHNSIDKKRTLPDFGKVKKQPQSAKIQKSSRNFLSNPHQAHNLKDGYPSTSSFQQPIQKLPLRQNATINVVESDKYDHTNQLSSVVDDDEEIFDNGNYRSTARFNCVEEEIGRRREEGEKGLGETKTSIENHFSQRMAANTTTSTKRQQPLTLSQFHLGPCKGKGRYGKVYLAIDKLTGWICALKQIPSSIVKQMLPQFINQVKLQSFLDHPYTTKIYGCFVDGESVYLVMEYMTEGTLYELIKKNGAVGERVAATKLHQVSQALSHMHSYHVIHRDLKPQNIVLTFGVCKICDFGWSIKSCRKRTTSCGTLDYLSPQMLRGTQYSSSIDLWAMGVMLYQMLVGKPPFYNVSIKQTAKRIKQCEFTLPEKLSAQSKSLIECFLRKNPGERRQMDGILRHPFFQKVEE